MAVVLFVRATLFPFRGLFREVRYSNFENEKIRPPVPRIRHRTSSGHAPSHADLFLDHESSLTVDDSPDLFGDALTLVSCYHILAVHEFRWGEGEKCMYLQQIPNGMQSGASAFASLRGRPFRPITTRNLQKPMRRYTLPTIVPTTGGVTQDSLKKGLCGCAIKFKVMQQVLRAKSITRMIAVALVNLTAFFLMRNAVCRGRVDGSR